jgi:GAF domain-containing protein/anti-sigma regulatory factor (Ser/Thr protein kinase)
VQARDDLVATAAYQPEPAAAAAARRFVRDTLQTWQVVGRSASQDELVDDAVLLTSELVTNAVVHAGTPVQVTCRLAHGAVEVVVLDRHPVQLVPDREQRDSSEAERTSGRGLMLPSELASSWGVTYARTAKAVWFRLGIADFDAADEAGGTDGPDRAAGAVPRSGASGMLTAAGTVGEGQPAGPDGRPARDRPAGSAQLAGGEWPAGSERPGDGRPLADGEQPGDHGRPGNDGLPAGGAKPAGAAAEWPPAGLPVWARRNLGRLGYEELLSHTVEAARAMMAADAAYLLAAGEDGELRVRAAAGAGLSSGPGFAQLAAGTVTVAAGPARALADAARSLVTVPLMAEGRVTGVLAVAATEPGRFRERDAARLQELADRSTPTLERARLGEMERARRARVSYLEEAGEVLAGSFDQEKIVALAAQLVVPQLADWCAVLLADAGGVPRPVYLSHVDETRAGALSWLLEHALPAALPDGADSGPGRLRMAGQRWPPATPARSGTAGGATATARTQPGAPPGAAQLAADGAWCFPLTAPDDSRGLLVIGTVAGGRLSAEITELAEGLARRVALALDNATRQARQQFTSRIRQAVPLPPDPPRIPGVELAVTHEEPGGGGSPGGDFYDIFPVGGDHWRFVIADVCGTGPEAAAIGGLARHTLRILAREGHGIGAVLERLNALIIDEGEQARFLTLVHGEITAGRPARVSLACAGHPLPLVLRSTAAMPEAAADPQPLLGVIEGLTFSTQTLDLDHGDLLLAMTDGITHRRHGYRLLDDGDGVALLLAESRDLSAGAVAARIQQAARDFGPAPLADDMALLVLRAS